MTILYNKKMTEKGKRAVILAHDAFGTLEGKTANCLVLYQRRFKIVAVIDKGKAGRDAGEVLGVGRKGIPIVGSFDESLKFGPEALIIGVAPPGGELPEEWRGIVKDAIRNGLDIVSGLHLFFSTQQEFVNLAKKYKAKFFDIRKPPKDLPILTGKSRNIRKPVAAILSTDAAAGKNVAIIELMKEAKKRGYEPGFVATGQTTIMIGADAGACIDAIPGDFMSGQTEKMVVDVAAMAKDIIFVERQASLSHPTYGQESLAILYGSCPDAIILVHDPFREKRDGFPQFEVPKPNEEIRMIETVCPKTKVVGIAINGGLKSDEEVKAAIKQVESETNLPANDVLRFGAGELFDCLLERFKALKKL